MKVNIMSFTAAGKEPANFSVIIATYNNEEYADDLYRSLDSQTIDPSQLEILIINDGSTDQSLAKANAWQKQSRLNVQVVTQENAGVSAARNTGIELAQGHWITFIDSDDVIHPDYFTALAEFQRRDSFSKASMLTSRSVLFLEDKGITVDNHPLSWKYKQGDRLVSLAMEPHVVHLGGHSTIVRRDVVMKNSLRFNSDVRPGFEDADFNGRYLSHFDDPVLGLVASARYYYRKRSAGTSLIDTAWTKPEKFTHEPKYGHLGMLRYVTDQIGYTPVWAQNMVLYGLYWYFSADRSWKNPFAGLSEELLRDFWTSLDQIFEYIEPSTIRSFPIKNYGWYLSEGILRYFKNESWVESKKTVVYQWGAVEKKTSTQKFVYSYLGPIPKEKFYSNGRRVHPLYTKSIAHKLFGRHIMYERIVALPADSHISISLNGKRSFITRVPAFNKVPPFQNAIPEVLQLLPGVTIDSPQEKVAAYNKNSKDLIVRASTVLPTFRSKAMEEAWVNGITVRAAGIRILNRSLSRLGSNYKNGRIKKSNAKIRNKALLPKHSMKFQNSWIFIDRPDRADDNAEHLYNYVLTNHPEINSWYMISRSSPDWSRLVMKGFRLIPYGESEAVSAILKAAFILSSHMDTEVYEPIDPKRFGSIRARRIFLQHGITMNDISRWINTKNIALVTACSPAELESIAGDGTNYRLMREQIELTGFPRHDKLLELARRTSIIDRSQFLIVPTWRKSLAEELKFATSDVERREILINSDFYQSWVDLIDNNEFLSWVKLVGLTVTFALHDHLSPYSDLFEFGEAVVVRRFSDISIQETLADCRIVLTDYSSLGVEAAVAGAEVVYYQSDTESIYDGSHTFERSWFNYSEHGVGPVVTKVSNVLDVLESLEERNWEKSRFYSERLNALLPNLDGGACERVIQSVKNI